VQEVSRLSNGNTLINTWTGNLPQEKWPSTIQLIEVTPAKQVVWALSDWKLLAPRRQLNCWTSPEYRERERFSDKLG
jgi:hypothetical protein